MFVEIGGVALTYYVGRRITNYVTNIDKRKVISNFNMIMECLGKKVTNDFDQTYNIYSMNKTKYGYLGLIQIPNGLDYEKLSALKETLQYNLQCLIEFEDNRTSNLVKAKFIFTPQNNKDFKPYKTKPNQIFLGYLPDGSACILDLNKDPHILIAGVTGTGKSFIFASILTNLIYNNKKDIEIYLFQIMKGEIDIFNKCPSVKFTSDNSEEILIMLEKSYNKVHERSKEFAKYGIKNITQWNTHFPNKRMKRIIIGVEEISFFTNQYLDEGKKEKNPFFDYFTGIVKAGRSVGIHFISSTQRTTAKNLGGSGELKSQMCVITGKQRSEDDSKNAIDIKDASKLMQQEYIYSGNEGHMYFRSPNIDEDYEILAEYVPEIITPSKAISKQLEKETKSTSNNNQDNVLICEKSEWIPLEEYNKRKQIEDSKSIKSNPIPPKKITRKNVIPIKGSEKVANN